MVKIYALYKGDKLIDTGTIAHLAKRRGVKPRTIEYYKTPTYKRRIKGKSNRVELIEVSE